VPASKVSLRYWRSVWRRRPPAIVDESAAAEAPGGSADFFKEGFFEDADRGEVAAEGFVEFGVEFVLPRPDEIVEILTFCRCGNMLQQFDISLTTIRLDPPIL